MNNPQKNFSDFLVALRLDDNAADAVFEAFSAILEEFSGKEMVKKNVDNRFSSFLEGMKFDPQLKTSLFDGYAAILENFTYSYMDPADVQSFSHQGFDMQGAQGPMFDRYDAFRIAPGGSDHVTSDAMSAGMMDKKAASPNPHAASTYRFPKAVLRSAVNVQKLIKQADLQIPSQSTENASGTTPFQRYNFSAYNTNMAFN